MKTKNNMYFINTFSLKKAFEMVVLGAVLTLFTACGGGGSGGAVEASANKFIITVKTDNTGDSSDVEFEIPTNVATYPAGYNYNVDCDNDGENETTDENANYICEYDSAGTYTIAIEGDFPQIYFNGEKDKNKIISIDQWGTNPWKNMNKSFLGCINLAGQASDNPDLNNVTNMSTMFSLATTFNQDISGWNVSNVTNMGAMFAYAAKFNQDISGWDVSSVENMGSMFFTAVEFNQNIGGWDVSNVRTMNSMFFTARNFNQDLRLWKVNNVTDMRTMFAEATSFDQNVGAWQPYAVTSMEGMFRDVTLSVANYRLLLEGWDFKKINLQDNVTFSGGNSLVACTGITDTECLAAFEGRQNLINDKGWIITDGEL